MRELNAILEALENIEKGQAPALATVVKVAGSAYRRPGARMFVYPDGRRAGTVSGGCLEADVVQHALQVLRTGEPEYLLYDPRASNGDVVAELGCGGSVGILIEPAASCRARRSLEFLKQAGESRRSGVMATAFQAGADTNLQIADRAFWTEAGARYNLSLSGGELPVKQSDLEEALQSGKAVVCASDAVRQSAEILLEPLQPPIALLICGDGQDAAPLAAIARSLGWSVCQPDSPSKFLEGESHSGSARDASEVPAPDGRTAAVIMSHNYSRDLAWLKALLPGSAGYIGLLGPRHRSLRMMADTQELRDTLAPEKQARLYSPVGLDIGAETPEEIAVAIAAEIQAALNCRTGGSLRSRPMPIHAENPPRYDPLPRRDFAE